MFKFICLSEFQLYYWYADSATWFNFFLSISFSDYFLLAKVKGEGQIFSIKRLLNSWIWK